MPIRCNRGFYCRSYCLLNMFRATLCPSSGAQEYYTVVAACGISCCKNNFVSFCGIDNTRHLRLRTQIPQKLTKLFLHFYSTKYHRQQPLYNTLELLMMGIVMPETCWASNKICKKKKNKQTFSGDRPLIVHTLPRAYSGLHWAISMARCLGASYIAIVRYESRDSWVSDVTDTLTVPSKCSDLLLM